MAKAVKKKKSKTEKNSLNKEMLEFYKGKNQEQLEKLRLDNEKKNLLKKQKNLLTIWTIIGVIISLIVGLIYFNSKKSLVLSGIVIIFSLVCFLIISDLTITKNQDQYYKNIKIVFELLTLLILAGNFIVLSNQTNIQSQQTQILEQTSQSIKPDVRVVSSQGDRAFSLEEVNSNEFSAQMGIGIVNLGKINAPFVLVSPKYPGLFTGYFHYINQKGELVDWPFSMENFSSLGYETAWFYFHKDIRSNETIKIGINNIIFVVKCAFCQNPSREEVIPICVYTNDSSKETECGKEYL